MLETIEKTPHGRSRYTDEHVEKGLMVLALNGGRPVRARDQLQAQFGLAIPETTLCKWRDHTHRDRYERIAEEHSRAVSQRIATEAEEIIALAGEAERKLLQRSIDTADQLEPREIPGAVRNITTVKSLNYDKISSPARGRPQTVVEHRKAPDEIMAGLKQAGILVVESTAEEIKPKAGLPATAQESAR